MREEMVFDKWMKIDKDGFFDGLRDDAPDEVKKAYAEYLEKQETDNGYKKK